MHQLTKAHWECVSFFSALGYASRKRFQTTPLKLWEPGAVLREKQALHVETN